MQRFYRLRTVCNSSLNFFWIDPGSCRELAEERGIEPKLVDVIEKGTFVPAMRNESIFNRIFL